jgi:hypothetical protein
MSSARDLRGHLGRRALPAALGLACLLSPAPALGLLGPKHTGILSPDLFALAKPSVRSLAPVRQAAVLGVAPSGPGSLLREGNRVLVNVRFESGAISRLADLEAAGAEVVSSSRRYQTVTVASTPAGLHRVAAVPGVASVTQSRAPMVYGAAATSVAAGSNCEGGAAISEGLAQLRVDKAREAFGLRGKGIVVGVLSDSFDRASEAADASGPIATHAHEDILSGDLPGPVGTCAGQQLAVDVLEDAPSSAQSSDEGRAMLQAVHDLAPHATLAFATAFNSEESFAQNIERLARPAAAGGAGAHVIVDDVAWFEEPFFQDGPIAAAIDKVTAEGVTYLSATGNDNLFEGKNEIASWEAPAFRDSGACPGAVEVLAGFNGSHCMDFNPGPAQDNTFEMTVSPHAVLRLDLQWDEPWHGVGTDLDAFLLDSGGKLLEASSEDNTGKTQRPVEIVEWENKSALAAKVSLAINRFSGADPRLKFILLENGAGVTKMEYPKSELGDVVGPTIFGHAGAAGAIALAAVRYDNGAAPEGFSSRGPVTHYFGPVAGTGPAAELLSPQTIAKPDAAATDCGATTFFAHRSDGVTWRFCGTSAAAPHAAAVAALLRQGNPPASVSQIRASLTETAVPVGAFPPAAVGSGLIDALAAVESLPEPVSVEDGPSIVVPALEGESVPLEGPPRPRGRRGRSSSGTRRRWCERCSAPPGSSSVSAPTRRVRPSSARSTTPRSAAGAGGSHAASRSGAMWSGSGPAIRPATPAGPRPSPSGSSGSADLAVPLPGLPAHDPVADQEQQQKRRDGAEDQRVGQVQSLQPGPEVDRQRRDRHVADQGRPDEAPERHPGGPGGVADEAEGDDRDQPQRQQQGDAAALDHPLEALEALAPEPAVQQRPRDPGSDRVTEQGREQPGDGDDRQGGEEAVGEAGRSVDDLRRVDDDGVDQCQGDDHQRAGDAKLVDLVADLGAVAVQGRFKGVAQRRHRDHQGGQQRDADRRDADLQPRQLRAPARRIVGPLAADPCRRRSQCRSRSARPEWRPPPPSRRTAASSAGRSPTRTQLLRARVIAV